MPRQGARTGMHRLVEATSHCTGASRYRAAWQRGPALLPCSDSSDTLRPCDYRTCNHIALPGCRRGASVTPAEYRSTPQNARRSRLDIPRQPECACHKCGSLCGSNHALPYRKATMHSSRYPQAGPTRRQMRPERFELPTF